MTPTDVVTGAFSYSGSYIAEALLAQGRRVRSLSRSEPSPDHPLVGRVGFARLRFDDPVALEESIRGAEVLYNTYWIRFPHAGSTFDEAVENSGTLFAAAQRAGVRRIVHLSVTHATDLDYPYFRGKAAVERVLTACEVPSAIVRPSLIFGGRQEILINNLAWLLRRLPVFLIPGDGRYRLQPVAVQDVATLAVRYGATDERVTVDAVGPEVYTFDAFMRLLRDAVGARTWIAHAPLWFALPASRVLGWFLRDVLVTPGELGEMMDEAMLSADLPTGETRFHAWLNEQADWLGHRYAHELNRNWSPAERP